MLLGIRLKAHPTDRQKLVLSQWMGCARFIWNAKCEENRYLTKFAQKYLPLKTYAPIDQTYSQYKDPELSPWLKDCPSQILRNSAVNWFNTYHKYLGKECGKPKRKRKSDQGSIHLTKEIFRFERCADGVTRLFVGSKTNNIGYLSFKSHREFKTPDSLYIKKKNGNYSVSFCYKDELDESNLKTQKQTLDYLRGSSREFLENHTIGIDRGVVRPVQAGNDVFDLTSNQKRNKKKQEAYLKFYQRRLARQKKGSKRRFKTKQKISRAHEKIANIRKDFCHKTSRSIVDKPQTKIIVLEDLRTKNITARPKPRQTAQGKWDKNGAKAKAGLNRSVLDKGWHQLETFIKYKSYRAGKVWFKISAYQTSQECAVCAHTHPNNRKTQSKFLCEGCGHTDNADHNAVEVIKKRTIRLILDPGTGLSDRGVLLEGTGRGAISKSRQAKASRASGSEASKKKRKAAKAA